MKSRGDVKMRHTRDGLRFPQTLGHWVGGVLILALVLTLSLLYLAQPSAAKRARTCYDKLLAGLTSEFNGRGYDVLSPGCSADYPMAYAMIASASAIMYQNTRKDSYLYDAIRNADWLVDNADLDQEGLIGWGVPIEVTSGEVSYPASHEYTITMTFVVQSLLDVVDAIERYRESHQVLSLTAKRDGYREVAKAAVAVVIDKKCFNEYPQGQVAFWYSCTPTDASYEATNIIAMMAGVLQRISHYVDESDLAATWCSFADGAVRFLLVKAKQEAQGTLYWDYRLDGTVRCYRQDLVHTGYTAWGLLFYSEFGGNLAGDIPLERITRSFAEYSCSETYPLIRFVDRKGSARLWGAAFQLAVLARANCQADFVQDAFSRALELRNEDGLFSFAYDNNSVYVRAEAATLLALSEYYRYLTRCDNPKLGRGSESS